MIDNNIKFFEIKFFNKKKRKKFNVFRFNIFRFRRENKNNKVFFRFNVLNLLKDEFEKKLNNLKKKFTFILKKDFYRKRRII